MNYSFTGKNKKMNIPSEGVRAYLAGDHGFVAIPTDRITSYKLVKQKSR